MLLLNNFWLVIICFHLFQLGRNFSLRLLQADI